MTLHSNFSGPLYQQVHDSLKSRITSGEWSKGMVIPGDAELSRQLGVSVGTVRKALDELARQRLVVRERGRGTFIKDESAWTGDLERFLHDRSGKPIGVKIAVVATETAKANPAELRALQLRAPREAPPYVHRIIRTWSHAERVVTVERITVDAARLPDLLDEADLTAPVMTAIYARKLRKPVGRTDWTFATGQVDERLAGYAGDLDQSSLLMCRRIMHDASDAPFEISEQFIDLTDGSYRLSR
ncbi:MAG: GntR family transcriptional regulator [Hyphomicrobiaceae bacterium]|nr:GntR family transcriptional regulator [Hyphomicrobiaceae bacterium]